MVQATGAATEAQVEAGVARVRARFVSMLEDRADELYDLLEYLDDPSVRDIAFREIQSRAHKLHGISGTIGFPKIGALAIKLETTLKLARLAGQPPNVQHVRRDLDDLLSEMECSLNGD